MQALVGFLEIDILADDGNGDLAFGRGKIFQHLPPFLKMGIAGRQAQQYGHLLVKAFLKEGHGQLVDIGHVRGTEDGVLFHVAEKGNLGAQVVRHRLLAAAEDNVRLYADGEKLLDAVLGGLGLVFAGSTQVRHQGQVDVQAVVTAKLGAELAYGFQEGQALDVADSAADFDNGHVRGILALAQCKDKALYFVRDMGNDLDRGSKVVAAALLGDDIVVNGAGGRVVFVGKRYVKVALVVPQIEVCLGSVVGNKHLAVLEGIHGSGIHVDIGIQLLNGHRDIAGLEQGPQRGCSQPFAKGRKHTARHKNKLRLHATLRQQKIIGKLRDKRQKALCGLQGIHAVTDWNSVRLTTSVCPPIFKTAFLYTNLQYYASLTDSTYMMYYSFLSIQSAVYPLLFQAAQPHTGILRCLQRKRHKFFAGSAFLQSLSGHSTPSQIIPDIPYSHSEELLFHGQSKYTGNHGLRHQLP